MALEGALRLASGTRAHGAGGGLRPGLGPLRILDDPKQTQLNDEYFIRLRATKSAFFFEDGAFADAGTLCGSRNRESLNKMGHAMHDLDPVFDAFSRSHGRWRQTVEPSAGLRGAGHHPVDVYFQAAGHRRGGRPATRTRRSSTRSRSPAIGFWFALEDATLENGCMQFIPGAHKVPAEGA